jgi:phosphoribosylglycinamide formyltransferase-1
MTRVAIFASGNGSNAENIIQYFRHSPQISFELILCNHPKATVLERADRLQIPTRIFNRQEFYHGNEILQLLQNKSIDLIILAGFMWLIPSNIITAFPQKIINIHPALLPKYGGKGMYGDFVHQAVSRAGETSTGITIHYVNENYDEGGIIFQKSINIEKGEQPLSIAKKIHALEYQYFPVVIEQLIKEKK